jgi:hypothetical protein
MFRAVENFLRYTEMSSSIIVTEFSLVKMG